MTRPVFPDPSHIHKIRDPEIAPTARRLDCALYNHCLSIADREGWQSFGCSGCRAYRPLDAAQRRADEERLVDLMAESLARVHVEGRRYSQRRG